MTERFNLVGSYLYDGDECISHFDDPKHRDEIVELLNDFYNENEQLKESNGRFSKTVAEQIIMIKEYREENEQLKQQINCLLNILNCLKTTK